MRRPEAPKRAVRVLACVTVAGPLVGCTVGPDYTRPVTPEHVEYREDAATPTTSTPDTLAPPAAPVPAVESVADLPWWELFRDPVLQDLIETAIANNRDLDVAMARIEEARAALGFQRANLIPRIDAVASGELEDTTAEGGVDASAVVAGAVSWEADLFGRLRRTNEAALRDLLATEEAFRGLTIALVAQVADQYILLRDLDNRLSVSEATAEARESSLEILRVRFSAGVISEVEVNQGEIELAIARSAVEAFRRLRGQTENVLAFLIGSPPTEIARGDALSDDMLPPDLPAGFPSDLLDRRPDILVAEHALAAQTARIGVAEALKYPSVTLSANIGASFASVTAGFLNMAADLFAPIFNAGQNDRRVEIEVARTRQALASYEQTVLNAFREVENAMIAVHRYEAEYRQRLLQLQAARNAAALSWARYEGGLTSYLEVLDVQRSEFSAELAASEALGLRLSSLVDLYRALGGGWTPPEEVSADAVGPGSR